MRTPSETQGAFARAVRDPGLPVPDGVTGPLRARPAKRFAIYRNNVHANLIAVLEGRFPVVARLVGDAFFRATARVYIEQHPPASPVLMRYGASFADFLDGFPPVADTPYLGDVARLEWARNEAYHAADAMPLGADALQGVAPEAERLAFTLHPSTQLVRSRFPVVTVWSANVRGEKPGPIDAGSGGEDALVVRPALTVEVRRLPEGGADFIAALARGATLGQAAAEAARESPGFDLPVNLAGLIRSGAVTAFGQADAGESATTKGRVT